MSYFSVMIITAKVHIFAPVETEMGIGNRKGDGCRETEKKDGLAGRGNILLFDGLVYPQPGAELGVCAVERAVRPVVVAETLRQVGQRLEVRRQQRLQVGLRESGHRRGGHRRRPVGGGPQDRARHPGVVGRQPFDDPLGGRQVPGGGAVRASRAPRRLHSRQPE